uniref:Uncharacterized protein n=1 Tax=viral metagenome TaxID=1070528 RepID=A0A6M3M3T1_9ZZZZ
MAREISKLKEILDGLPTVESIGLTKAREGPPLPAALNIRWPKRVRDYAEKTWPGVPIPREVGETVVKYLPLGLGHGVQKVVDSLGL